MHGLTSAVAKVGSTFGSAFATMKTQAGQHAQQVAAKAREVPAQASAKKSQADARLNEAAQEGKSSGGGVMGWIKDKAKALANAFASALKFVGKLLSDPGFWVSLVVAVAVAALVVAAFATAPFTAPILIVLIVAGAAAGAAGGGAGQIVTNLAGHKTGLDGVKTLVGNVAHGNFKGWSDGVVKSMVIGGVAGAVLAPLGPLAGRAGRAFADTRVGQALVGQAERVGASRFGQLLSKLKFWGSEKAPPRFTQTTASPKFNNGPFAGQTMGEVAAGIRNGTISPSQLPIDIIVRNGQRLALNTRSALTLRRAGVPTSRWVTRDVTGNPMFERILNERLARNALEDAGTDVIRITGVGGSGSSLQ
jgi:hypothetical protein